MTPLLVNRFTVLLLISLLSQLRAAAQELVVNGGFETPKVPVNWWTPYAPGTGFSGWWVGSAGVDLTSTGYFKSQGGVQSIDLNGSDSGEIYQDISTVPGQTYRLSFFFGANPYGQPAVRTMEVRWGSNLLAVLVHDNRDFTLNNPGWQKQNFLVTGSGSDRLTFRSRNESAAGPALDDVSLVAEAAPVQPTGGLIIQKAVQIAFPTVAGKTYQVQWAPAANTNSWTFLNPAILGDGKTHLVYDASEANAVRIYRVLSVE